jgi:cytochrome P450
MGSAWTNARAGVEGEDAGEFDPDRFLPERSRGWPKHSYKPFGTGERACIGRQFALHEAVLVLARILHRYDLAGDPSYDLAVTERLTDPARSRAQRAAAGPGTRRVGLTRTDPFWACTRERPAPNVRSGATWPPPGPDPCRETT